MANCLSLFALWWLITQAWWSGIFVISLLVLDSESSLLLHWAVLIHLQLSFFLSVWAYVCQSFVYFHEIYCVASGSAQQRQSWWSAVFFHVWGNEAPRQTCLLPLRCDSIQAANNGTCVAIRTSVYLDIFTYCWSEDIGTNRYFILPQSSNWIWNWSSNLHMVALFLRLAQFLQNDVRLLEHMCISVSPVFMVTSIWLVAETHCMWPVQSLV